MRAQPSVSTGRLTRRGRPIMFSEFESSVLHAAVMLAAVME
jgi:hypothetical protein